MRRQVDRDQRSGPFHVEMCEEVSGEPLSIPNAYADATGLCVDPSEALEDLLKQMLNE
jgi:hypothetical protein